MEFICPNCRNSGMVKNENNEPILCECVKRKRLLALYKSIGLPLRLMNADLSQYTIKQDAYGNAVDIQAEQQKMTAKNVVNDFINSLPSMLQGIPFQFIKEKNNKKYEFTSFNLVLSGKKDSGKSMLAACIAKGALKQKITPFYLEWSEVINACYDYYNDAMAKNVTKIQRYENIIDIIANSELLIIDNLDSAYESAGAQTNTSYDDRLTSNVRRQIDSMFSSRSKDALPTVITTNQSFKELTSENKYGPVLLNLIEDAIKVNLPTLGRSDKAMDMKQVN